MSPTLHSYHCLCSTHLLTTPYTLPSLPRRASPSLDRAFILPLPAFPSADEPSRHESAGKDIEIEDTMVLPSLLSSAFRPQRKVMVVQRADGYERRRVWRCGRCGVGVGYEIEGVDAGTEGGHKKGETVIGGEGEEVNRGRMMYLLEGGLVETEEMVGGMVG